ncbi:MAG: hypothetical protein D6706_02080 [Chloroflexi bacterium]|nr:MAG: hypothetical protein D6706_02080 [Chloroflexota bacterium]
MARHHTDLATQNKTWHLGRVAILVSLLVLLAAPGQAIAQSGTCPDWTNALEPPPTGFYPASAKVCVGPDPSANVFIAYDSDLPCGAGVSAKPIFNTFLTGWEPIVFVPPATMPLNGRADLGFLLYVDVSSFPAPDEIIFRVRSYSATGDPLSVADLYIYNYPKITAVGGFVPAYDVKAEVDAETGGFFSITLESPGPLYISGYTISSLRVAPPGNLPPHCLAAAVPTATPTAIPTATPTATGTTTPPPTATATTSPTTTPTPWPTAPGGTITPLPTRTPYTPQELPPEPTITPLPNVYMPLPQMGTVTFPSVTLPTISTPDLAGYSTPAPFDVGMTPDATTQAEISQIGGWISETQSTANQWLTSTNEALGWFSPHVTATTGISSPVEIADTMISFATQPVGYVRSLAVYMPNIWPYVLAVFLMLLWVFLNLLVKFGLAIVSEFLEVLRKVIELIPGM